MGRIWWLTWWSQPTAVRREWLSRDQVALLTKSLWAQLLNTLERWAAWVSRLHWQRPGRGPGVGRIPAQWRPGSVQLCWGHSLHSWCPQGKQSLLITGDKNCSLPRISSQGGRKVGWCWLGTGVSPVKFYCSHCMKETLESLARVKGNMKATMYHEYTKSSLCNSLKLIYGQN